MISFVLPRVAIACLLALAVLECPAHAEAADAEAEPSPTEVMREMRERVFSLNPAELGLAKTESLPNVWGVVMEWVQSEAVVTLVSFADGSTSIYFSTGGGLIGGGEHESVRKASGEFLETAQGLLSKTSKAEGHPPPPRGTTRFYVLTHSGIRVANALDDAVRVSNHPMYPLFARGQEVITQLRLSSPNQ